MNVSRETTLPLLEERLEEELADGLGLADYKIDRIKARSSVYLNQDWRKDVAFARKATDRMLVGISGFLFVFLVIFCYAILGLFPVLLCYMGAQALLLAWRFLVSPVRYHAMGDDMLFVKYRGYLEHGPRLRALFKDEKYKIATVMYLMLDVMVMFSFTDTTRMLPYINNIIFNRGEYPDSLVTSLVPALAMLGLAINIIGAAIASRYKVIDKATGTERKSPRVQAVLFTIAMGSIVILIILATGNAPDFAAYFKPAPTSDNWLYFFDPDQPLYRTRLAISAYYILVYAGASVIVLLAIMGLSVLENALLQSGQNRVWNSSMPPERNWEYKGVVARQDKAVKDKVKARKFAFGEILFMSIAVIVAFWPLMYGGKEIWHDAIMEYAGYGIVGIAIIWAFLFSPIYHVKHDGTYHYPTKKHNIPYALFDERGLGSMKHYFREILPKKRSLVLWTLYFTLMIVSVLSFDDFSIRFINWEDMFESYLNALPGTPLGSLRQPEGIIIDFVALFIDHAAPEAALAIILVATTLSIVAFVGALGKTKDNFKGSTFWSIFFKVVVGLIVTGCFFWITKVPQITGVVDLLSVKFFTALGIVVGFFGIAAIALLVFFIPYLVKFDNLTRHIAREVVIIIAITVVLMGVLTAIFDFFLPMTDINGDPIVYGSPFRFGEDYEVSNLVDKFDLGVFFMGWFGRYVIWGSVQQFLLMSYFLTLWRKVFPRSKGYIVAVGTSCIFGVIHAIDWPLMAFTAIAGLIWTWYWQKEYYDPVTGRVVRGNNLLFWGIVHGFGGTLLGMIAPFSLAVGPFNM